MANRNGRPRVARVAVCPIAAALGFVALSARAAAPPVPPGTVIAFGVSPPLREIESPPEPAGPAREAYEPGPLPVPPSTGEPDPGLQTSFGRLAMPGTGMSFAGVGIPNYTSPWVPPDTNGDVGDATAPYYVEITNTDIGVFSKTTGALAAGFPKASNVLWSSLSGTGCAVNNDGDGVAKFDKRAGRWVVSQFSVTSPKTYGYLECVAVSQTPDPTGSWYEYAIAIDATGTYFDDYPKMGIWPDAYYFTFNIFKGNTLKGVEYCALNRTQMLAGASNPQTACFGPVPGSIGAGGLSGQGGVLPADIDGPTDPPAGSPNYAVNFGANSLSFWQFTVNWTTPSSSTVTGPVNVAVNPFTALCNGATCVPQPGTSRQLDSLADRLMYRLSYRNFGTYESMVVNHSVDPSGTGTGPGAIRWYEIRSPATPTIFQQGTFAPTSDFRWMGSIGQDHMGDLAVGYSVSNATTIFPSIAYAGRLVSDPLGQLGQGEATMVTGTGSQTGATRWGDYSSMSVDPSDDCTFWYTQEWIPTSGSAWSTQIGSFKFPSCSVCTPPSVPGSVVATASAPNQITVTWGAVGGATSYNVYRSSGACPGGTFTQIATGVTGTSYVDSSVTGGFTYSYEVTSVATCESGKSTCSSATATGLCTSFPNQPTGLSATAASTGTCGVNLSWTAGSSNCGGSVTYSIYRSTSSGFTPSASNRIALGVSGTAYSDTGALSPSTPYYYIVHAVDTLTGAEETNTSQASATTSSSCALGSSNAQAFTVTSTGTSTAGQNFLEWWNPASASATSWTVTINVRTDQFPTGPTDGLARTVTAGRAISAAGSVDSLVDNNGGAGLVDGTTYYYALWVRN